MELSRRNSQVKGLDTFLSGLSKGIIMDINRNKRKDHHEPSEFSQQSILSAMDRFVQAVNNMDDTIMVPSRLLDMSLDSKSGIPASPTGDRKSVLPRNVIQTDTDLYSFYNMLNAVKTELIWGAADGAIATAGNNNATPATVGPAPGKNVRRMSTASMHSYSDSDVESVSSTEGFDSGVDFDEQSLRIASSFRQHLHGLFHSLHQLTESANYLTSRYQDEVGGSS